MLGYCSLQIEEQTAQEREKPETDRKSMRSKMPGEKVLKEESDCLFQMFVTQGKKELTTRFHNVGGHW